EENKEENKEGEEKKEGEEDIPLEEEQEQDANKGKFKEVVISLGQGQEENALKSIEDGLINGNWVLLANCHLFSSFMSELANKVQDIRENPNIQGHDNFRLWLTSMPSEKFPVSILQNSLKLTTEPPSGVKSNMKKLFDPISDESTIFHPKPDLTPHDEKKTPEEIKAEQEGIAKEMEEKRFHYTKLLFSLTLFHSVVQERKKFGPIGFNMRYDFNQSDFDTSSEFAKIYINEEDGYVPLESILYLIGEVTYGGCITDETDRLVMSKTLDKFINDDLFIKRSDILGEEPDKDKITKKRDFIIELIEDENELFFGDYAIKNYKNLAEYRKYIPSLPSFDDPDIFGLNQNANIVYELKESNTLLNVLSNIMPKGQGASANKANDSVMEIINTLINQPIELIDIKNRHKAHDKLYDNELRHSLTIVLFQEVEKYNKLIYKIDSSLRELKRAIEGTSVMSLESEEIYGSLLLNKVPLTWSKMAYTSVKSFGSWLNDLKKRVEFISNWLINGFPTIYWISGLYYPHGFITGVFQTHARETKTPVNDIIINFHVMEEKDEDLTKPKYGVYVNGLFLEGASWDHVEGVIDQKPGEMWCTMPTIWFETVKDTSKKDNDEEEEDEGDDDEGSKYQIYSCPMFKTSRRAQIIASTGNSVEKIIEVKLKSKKPENYWILRGAALLMQLDDYD
ncbi:MAG: hypothetical protein MJ252_26230, partial [archaeon]|nr:hypothetical protein [archaeon]